MFVPILATDMDTQFKLAMLVRQRDRPPGLFYLDVCVSPRKSTAL